MSKAPARTFRWIVVVLGSALGATCGGSGAEPIAIRLIDLFEQATVEGTGPAAPRVRTEWRFDGKGTIPAPKEHGDTFGWRAMNDVDGLAVREGRLVGTTDELPVLHGMRPEDLDQDDLLHAIEIRMRVSAGTRVGVTFNNAEKLNEERVLETLRDAIEPPLSAPLTPGEDPQTYTLTNFGRSFPIATIRNILLQPTDAKGAQFEIESIRLIPRKEHLVSIPSGPGWQGLGEVYRETIVSRSPERILLDLEAPSGPWLDLAVGTIEDGPVTFKVAVSTGSHETNVLRRTVTMPRRWESTHVDLSPFAGERVRLALSLEADHNGMLGFWGSPVVRSSGAAPSRSDRSPARSALADGGQRMPQGVILILADTLRRDHLNPYGYERPTAPVLARLAKEGVLFADNIAQATWTKISVPSILTSLYATSHGLVGPPDRVASSATTLAEAYRDAGYATFHTSSVQFTGKLSNLHQGVEVLHERASIQEIPQGGAKTARIYVDRFLQWLDDHKDVPFFAFVHVFDPHSPFEPYAPYDTMWAAPSGKEQHEERLKKVRAALGSKARRGGGTRQSPETLPDKKELEQAKVDPNVFVAHEVDWYDGSIRGLDVEVGRLLEGLDQLGLGGKTVVAFISDHGEELLDHGKHFHGNTLYGEMLNVPLVLWWPGIVPASVVVEETVESINLAPTLLELSGIARPEGMQGQSLLPWLARPDAPSEFGWVKRAAFSERKRYPNNAPREPEDLDGFSIVMDGWKLIQNINPPEGFPEYELYNHVEDPVNHHNVAGTHPEIVQRLAQELAARRKWAEARRLPSDEDATEGLSPEELSRLRSLGYIR